MLELSALYQVRGFGIEELGMLAIDCISLDSHGAVKEDGNRRNALTTHHFSNVEHHLLCATDSKRRDKDLPLLLDSINDDLLKLIQSFFQCAVIPIPVGRLKYNDISFHWGRWVAQER